MHRFYIAGEIGGDKIAVTNAGQLHHLKDVLRLGVGDEVTVFDDKGKEYACVIAQLRKSGVVLAVKARKCAEDKKVRLTVACALPKKSGMDAIVDGLTQLGVDEIIPMETERVVVRLDAAKKEARLGRWRGIARSAAEQSQRADLPRVGPVMGIEDVIAHSGDFDLRLLPALAGQRQPIREVMARSRPTSILVLIGPEGDFTPQEVEMAQSAGFIPVSLGASVLRVATAAIAVASYIRLSLGL